MNSASVHPYPVSVRYLASPTLSSSSRSSLSPIPSPISTAWEQSSTSSSSFVPHRTLRPSSRSSTLASRINSFAISQSTVSPTHPLSTTAWGPTPTSSPKTESLSRIKIYPSSSTSPTISSSSSSPNRTTLPPPLPLSVDVWEQGPFSPPSGALVHGKMQESSSSSASSTSSSLAGTSSRSEIAPKHDVILHTIADELLCIVFEYASNPSLLRVNKRLKVDVYRVLTHLVYKKFIQPHGLRGSLPLLYGQPDLSYISRHFSKYFQMMLSSYLHTRNAATDNLSRIIPTDILPTNFSKLCLLSVANSPQHRTVTLSQDKKALVEEIKFFQTLCATNSINSKAEIETALQDDPRFFSRQLRSLFDQINLETRGKDGYPSELYELATIFCVRNYYDEHLLYADWHYVFLVHTHVVLTRNLDKGNKKHLLNFMLDKMIAKVPKDPQGKIDLSRLCVHLNRLLAPTYHADLRAKMQKEYNDKGTIAVQFERNLLTVKSIFQPYLSKFSPTASSAQLQKILTIPSAHQ